MTLWFAAATGALFLILIAMFLILLIAGVVPGSTPRGSREAVALDPVAQKADQRGAFVPGAAGGSHAESNFSPVAMD